MDIMQWMIGISSSVARILTVVGFGCSNSVCEETRNGFQLERLRWLADLNI